MRALAILPLLFAVARAQEPPGRPPDATVDLAAEAGLALVKGAWRYADARIVETAFRAAGPDGQPTGPANRTWTIEPKAGAADFDDAAWEAVPPAELAKRRGAGRLGFGWYRLAFTVPERIGDFDPTGATVVLDVSIDDAVETWVDGELARHVGQEGGSMVAGWNAPNRVVVGRGVKPGRRIVLALFAVNGPLSNPPTNYLWVRHARLAFFAGLPCPVAVPPSEVNVEVERLDPAMDAVIGPNPKMHKLAEGFDFTEGPVWMPEGFLLFSDPNRNRIYRYVPDGTLEVFREKSGYDAPDLADYRQPGSNGLALDPEGRLAVCEHGRRRVVRLGAGGDVTVLADRFEGKRLNSPNDLVFRSDGSLWFTDPPFGLPKVHDDPRRETPAFGVYRRGTDGRLSLVVADLRGPNGIAFSPDERWLYVGNWDPARKVVMRYPVGADGTLGDGTVFHDFTSAPGEDAIDGLKVDRDGRVYVSGPGALWVLAPDGRAIGAIRGPRHVHNMAWGDADGKTLYLCAREALYRVRLNVAGAGRSDRP